MRFRNPVSPGSAVASSACATSAKAFTRMIAAKGHPITYKASRFHRSAGLRSGKY